MTPIFHITHVENLTSIVEHGCLWSDSQRIEKGIDNTNIGHSHIKARRLKRPVPTAAKGFLGDYVPFYFCNRSVMLYVAHRRSVDGYDGGQEPIVHLVSSVEAAARTGRSWTFTDRHAELGHARFFDDLNDLNELDWEAMEARYWQNVKEVRQAEFLVHRKFLWGSIKRIVVHNDGVAKRAANAIAKAAHRPSIAINADWYY